MCRKRFDIDEMARMLWDRAMIWGLIYSEALVGSFGTVWALRWFDMALVTRMSLEASIVRERVHILASRHGLIWRLWFDDHWEHRLSGSGIISGHWDGSSARD